MFHSDTHIDLRQPGPQLETPPAVTKTQILAALAVSMGSMIVGFCSAWSSPAIASLMEPGSKLEVTMNCPKSNFFNHHSLGIHVSRSLLMKPPGLEACCP